MRLRIRFAFSQRMHVHARAQTNRNKHVVSSNQSRSRPKRNSASARFPVLLGMGCLFFWFKALFAFATAAIFAHFPFIPSLEHTVLYAYINSLEEANKLHSPFRGKSIRNQHVSKLSVTGQKQQEMLCVCQSCALGDK